MERKEKIKIAVRQNRAMKSENEKGKVKEKDKIRKATMRKNMTEAEKISRREKDKQRKAEKRKLKKELEKVKMRNDEEEKRKKVEEKEVDWNSLMFPDATESGSGEETDDSKDDKEKNDGEGYFEKLRRINRKSQMKKRSKRSNVEIEFDRIDDLIRKREERRKRDGKKHLLDNLASKRSMRDLVEKGPIIDFADRDKNCRNRSEIEIWSIFWDRTKECRRLLEKKRPEVAEILKENMRKKEEEKKREVEEKKRKEEEHKKAIQDAVSEGRVGTGSWEGYAWVDGDWFWAGDPDEDPEKPKGEWVYQADIDDYHWVGEGPPPPEDLRNDNLNNWEVTEEDEKRRKEQEEKWLEMELEKQKKKQSDYMKEYREKKKQKLNEPIEISNYGEKSPYLLLQEKNIQERKDWMKASGLFD